MTRKKPPPRTEYGTPTPAVVMEGTRAAAVPDPHAEVATADKQSTDALEQLRPQIDSFEPALLAVRVTNEVEAKRAAGFGRSLMDMRKAIEDDRDEIVKPIRAAATRLAAKYKPTLDRIGRCLDHLKAQVGAYEAAVAQAHQAALAAAATPEALALAAIPPERTEGVQQRANWSYEIVDQAAIPKEYWLLDTTRLAREARERKSELSIPGIRPVQVVATTFR